MDSGLLTSSLFFSVQPTAPTTTPATTVPATTPAAAQPEQNANHLPGNAVQEPIREAATSNTLNFALQNNTKSSNVYAYVTGQAIDNNYALFLLRSDGRTAYYPASPSSTGAALSANVGIPLGAPGSTTTITIPHLAGARLWFSVNAKLTFLLNPGPALVEPSVTNPSDPNINIHWDFCEFTYNSAQIFANISYVDFVSIPISLTLATRSSGTKHVSGLPANGLATICNNLIAQSRSDGRGWNKLVVKDKAGNNLRALSPNDGIITNNSLFNGYYQPFVDAVYSKYSQGSTLSVDTQVSYGVVTGTVNNNVFNIAGQIFAKPSTADIFSCSTGPFANPTGNQLRNAIIPRLAAAFNRSTLLTTTRIPDPNEGDYYQELLVTNHYSRIVHAANLDGRGYAFPYDDVAPSGGKDQSGSVFDGAPTLLTVGVGGNGAYR
ncbi:glycoside hydrolase family 64 protein [Saccharata proteae CBS 121410]|uniref:Glycoside hydrolase family 64 protein n=1 Tax=Saccharata proteae CBS 121410 TaxID=1314787 RepID=A0A9P4LZK5_9PEZI|nr:glycoside hydrolase family 64 protein [Saccharata proteae CBS 121410]